MCVYVCECAHTCLCVHGSIVYACASVNMSACVATCACECFCTCVSVIQRHSCKVCDWGKLVRGGSFGLKRNEMSHRRPGEGPRLSDECTGPKELANAYLRIGRGPAIPMCISQSPALSPRTARLQGWVHRVGLENPPPHTGRGLPPAWHRLSERWLPWPQRVVREAAIYFPFPGAQGRSRKKPGLNF